MDQRKALKGFAFGLIAGALAGGITALLFAPKSGRELRKDIKSKSVDVVADVENYLKSAKDKARVMINDGRDKSTALIADARERAEELLRDTEQMIAGAKARVASDAARLHDAVKAGTDAFSQSGDTGRRG